MAASVTNPRQFNLAASPIPSSSGTTELCNFSPTFGHCFPNSSQVCKGKKIFLSVAPDGKGKPWLALGSGAWTFPRDE